MGRMGEPELLRPAPQLMSTTPRQASPRVRLSGLLRQPSLGRQLPMGRLQQVTPEVHTRKVMAALAGLGVDNRLTCACLAGPGVAGTENPGGDPRDMLGAWVWAGRGRQGPGPLSRAGTPPPHLARCSSAPRLCQVPPPWSPQGTSLLNLRKASPGEAGSWDTLTPWPPTWVCICACRGSCRPSPIRSLWDITHPDSWAPDSPSHWPAPPASQCRLL